MAEEYEIINGRVYDTYKRVGVLYSAVNNYFWVNDNITNPINNKFKMFCPELVFHLWKYGNMDKFYDKNDEGLMSYNEEGNLLMKKLELQVLMPLTLEWIPRNVTFRIGIKSIDSEMLGGAHKEFIEYYDQDEWSHS